MSPTAFTPGDSGEVVAQAVEKLNALISVRILRLKQLDFAGQQVLDGETWVDPGQVREAADQETGADQQHQRHSHLAYHQGAPQRHAHLRASGARRAGATPNSTPVRSEIASANSNTSTPALGARSQDRSDRSGRSSPCSRNRGQRRAKGKACQSAHSGEKSHLRSQEEARARL